MKDHVITYDRFAHLALTNVELAGSQDSGRWQRPAR